ncbi:MAG: plastocyanin/azurin family copper-binding protein [Oryzihumus sp.]
MGRTARDRAVMVGAVAALLTFAACGGTSGGGGSAAAPSTSAKATATGQPVSVVEKEFSIVLTPKPVKAGNYTFTIHNAGTFPHNLNIKGPGVAQQSSATVSPGQSGDLTVTLQQGSYELWCSVDSHKERGMDLTLKVG